MGLRDGIDLGQVDIAALQRTLKADGVYLEDVPR
jgi:hypothetical protein